VRNSLGASTGKQQWEPAGQDACNTREEFDCGESACNRGKARCGIGCEASSGGHDPGPAPVAGKTAVPVRGPATPQKVQVAKAPVAPQKGAVAKAPVKGAPVTATKGTKTEGQAKPASAKEQTTATRVGKQRDPFVSPVVRSNGNISAGCDTGKRCLVVDQIVLKGIVKSPAGFIAVVENPAKRAYFMRENDPVFNGKITRITGDTVVFQEQVMDKVGKQSVREVVKKVNAPIV
jgi:Tfp pilus assembly protein PilP